MGDVTQYMRSMTAVEAAAWASSTLSNLKKAGITEQGKRRLCELLENGMNRVVAEKARKARQTAEAAQHTAEAARQAAEAAQHTAEATLQAVSAELVSQKLLQKKSATEERPEEAEEKEAAEAAQAPKKRKKEPPFTEEEDDLLLAELPIEKGGRREVARSLAKRPELSRRNEQSICDRLFAIEKKLENGLSLGGGQLVHQTLAPGLELAKAALRLSCHLAMLPTGGVVLPPGTLDSLYTARPADSSPTGKAPMVDEPTWLTGGKGEYIGMILFERLFQLQTKLVRQGQWGGPDLMAFDLHMLRSDRDACGGQDGPGLDPRIGAEYEGKDSDRQSAPEAVHRPSRGDLPRGGLGLLLAPNGGFLCQSRYAGQPLWSEY